MSEQKEIDVLVTGLPVSQYMDVERREALKSRFEGEHQITPKRSVAVKSVVVVPTCRCFGMDVVSSTKDEDLPEIIQEEKNVVIDPGSFSLDWVALEEERSAITHLAPARRCRCCYRKRTGQFQEDPRRCPGIEKIEKAIRAGKAEIFPTVKGYRSKTTSRKPQPKSPKRLDPLSAEANA